MKTETSKIIYGIVRAMRSTGNRPGVVRQWKAAVDRWAQQTVSPDAESVKAMLPLWQDRPAYTAAELVPIMPALALMLFGRTLPHMSPARLTTELFFACLPSREIDGKLYFLVEQIHYWRIVPEENFRAALNG